MKLLTIYDGGCVIIINENETYVATYENFISDCRIAGVAIPPPIPEGYKIFTINMSANGSSYVEDHFSIKTAPTSVIPNLAPYIEIIERAAWLNQARNEQLSNLATSSFRNGPKPG